MTSESYLHAGFMAAQWNPSADSHRLKYECSVRVASFKVSCFTLCSVAATLFEAPQCTE